MQKDKLFSRPTVIFILSQSDFIQGANIIFLCSLDGIENIHILQTP